MASFTTNRNFLVEGSVLRTESVDENGVGSQRRLQLSECLGNDDGKFRWGWSNFQDSAEDIKLEQNILYARLRTRRGNYVDASVDLDGLIGNQNRPLVNRPCRCYDNLLRNLEISRDHGESNGTQKAEGIVEDLLEIETRRTVLDIYFEQQSTFRYLPLTKSTSIRLLKIDPVNDSPDIVNCSLFEVDLQDCPRFAALSYTWGNPFPPTGTHFDDRYTKMITIGCNGQRLDIGQNLYDALRRIRYSRFEEQREPCYNKTELISKAEEGSLEDVERLLREGAEIAAVDKFGKTALHYAAENGNLDIVKALVYAGSCVHNLDNLSRTPLECARQRRRGAWEEVEKVLTKQLNAQSTINSGQGMERTLQGQVTNSDFLWVDAICIDQSNDVEKSVQVAMMGDIYKSAQSVVVWLGPDSPDSTDYTDDLLRGVWRLEGARDSKYPGILDSMIQDPDDGVLVNEDSTPRRVAEEWLATIKLETFESWILGVSLFRRKYFERSWILQEVLLAKNLTVVCGSFLVPWDIFLYMSCVISWVLSSYAGDRIWKTDFNRRITAYAGSFLLTGYNHKSDKLSSIALERRRRAIRAGGKLSMYSAFNLIRRTRATDPRDKVFSLAAITNIEQPTKWGRKPIVVDYAQTATELYIRVAKALFDTYGPIVLSLSSLNDASSIEGLPSWVPNLSSTVSVTSRALDIDQILQVSDRIKHTLKFDATTGAIISEHFKITSQNELFVKAYVWDIITEVADPGLNSVGSNLCRLAQWSGLLSSLKAGAVPKAQVLWRTIVEDRAAASADSPLDRPDVQHYFKRWLFYITFATIFDLRDVVQEAISSSTRITCDVISRRTTPLTVKLLQKAEFLFEALGIPIKTDPSEDHVSYVHRHFEYWVDCFRPAALFSEWLTSSHNSRRLLRTAKTNMLGTGPEQAQVGDAICFVHGARVPFVFRKLGKGRYRLVGEAYVYGVPDSWEDLTKTLKGPDYFRSMRSAMIGNGICIV